MHSRYLLPVVLFITTLNVPLVLANTASITQQRSLYNQAKLALSKNDTSVYLNNSAVLRNYPLTPYLAYDELTQRLPTASSNEIEKFLLEHGDLPQINWMKLRWLRLLSERQQWPLFLKYYSPELNFIELDCRFARYKQLLPRQKSYGSALNPNPMRATLYLIVGAQQAS